MKWIFNKKTVPSEKESVQSELLMYAIIMCQNSDRAILTVPSEDDLYFPPKPLKNEYVSLALKMGFNNCIQVRDYMDNLHNWSEKKSLMLKELESRKKKALKLNRETEMCFQGVKLLKKARNLYKDALLIPYDDFEKVIRKYDLRCGTFDDYIGDIPSEIFPEIEKSRKAVEQLGNSVNNLLKTIFGVDRRFPFVPTPKGSVRVLICAHSTEMILRTGPGGLDPFIIAHTDYGILVFARWGEEANDFIIKRYEELDRLLDSVSL